MTLHDRVGHHLGWLYPHFDAQQISSLAGRVIDSFASAAATAASGPAANATGSDDREAHRFRSDEVMLITYGDTFVNQDQPHLRSLAQFWDQHFADTFSTVHVLPFFSSSSDGGFSVVDYRQVANGLGDWADLAAIGADEVMFDLVCNHGSAQSDWFADFVADREPGRRYYVTAEPDSDLSAVVRPRTHPLLLAVDTEVGTRHVWATFSHDQIDFDFAEPDVLVEFCSILGFYMAQGASRIRLDAIAYLWKQIGTSCVHLPQTHRVVKLMRTLVEDHDPSALLITETNVPHKRNVSYFGDLVSPEAEVTDEAHVVYNFTLAPLIAWSLIAERADTITSWLGQLEPPPPGCAFLNFLASHDGIGLRPVEDLIPLDELDPLIQAATAVGGDYSAYSAPGGPRPYELNVSLADLLAGTDGETSARYVVAHALMLATQGIPAFYVHSMLVSPGDVESVVRTGHKRDINRGRIDLVDATERVSSGWRGETFDMLSKLIRVRRSHAAFGPESSQVVHVLHDQVVALERSDGTDQILALHNMARLPVTFDVPAAFADAHEIISDRVLSGPTITLAPWEPAWLQSPSP